jgi:hypothetical protein
MKQQEERREDGHDIHIMTSRNSRRVKNEYKLNLIFISEETGSCWAYEFLSQDMFSGNDLAMQVRHAETEAMHRRAIRITVLNQPHLRIIVDYFMKNKKVSPCSVADDFGLQNSSTRELSNESSNY